MVSLCAGFPLELAAPQIDAALSFLSYFSLFPIVLFKEANLSDNRNSDFDRASSLMATAPRGSSEISTLSRFETERRHCIRHGLMRCNKWGKAERKQAKVDSPNCERFRIPKPGVVGEVAAANAMQQQNQGQMKTVQHPETQT